MFFFEYLDYVLQRDYKFKRILIQKGMHVTLSVPRYARDQVQSQCVLQDQQSDKTTLNTGQTKSKFFSLELAYVSCQKHPWSVSVLSQILLLVEEQGRSDYCKALATKTPKSCPNLGMPSIKNCCILGRVLFLHDSEHAVHLEGLGLTPKSNGPSTTTSPPILSFKMKHRT